MRKPRLLDLFCGAGGAAMGYHRAGFEVVGVDIKPQPHYPFEFFQADALWFAEHFGVGYDDVRFDAIHASPPCQAFTIAQNARKRAHLHPDITGATRDLLNETGLPYVIENVPGSPLRPDLILCGTQFGLTEDGFELRRHRVFELNWQQFSLVSPCLHTLPAAPVFGHNPGRDFMRRYGRGFSADAKRRIMECEWMNRNEVAEAIPPAFTEFIGAQLLAHVREREAVVSS